MNIGQRGAARKFLPLALVVLAPANFVALPAPSALATSRTTAVVRQADPPASTPSVNVAGKVTTGSSPWWLDYVPLAGFAAAVLTLWLISRQLKSADRAARQERAAEYAAVWMDRDFRTLLSPVVGFLELRDVDDCLCKIRAWVSAAHSEDPCLPSGTNGPNIRKNDVNHVLGVVEDVAIRYNMGAADRVWIERLLGAALVRLLDSGLWFVCFFRAWEESPTLSTELEAMIRDLREAKDASMLRSLRVLRNRRLVRKRRRQTEERTYDEITQLRPQCVRVICLPPGPCTASDKAWAEASRLSASLASDYQSILGYGKAQSGAGWRAIVVPSSIDSTKHDNQCDELLASQLNGYLRTLPDIGPDVDPTRQ